MNSCTQFLSKPQRSLTFSYSLHVYKKSALLSLSLSLRFKLDIDSKTVVQVKEHRVLGITIDDEFKWQSHVSNICKTVSKNIFLMSQLKRYVRSQTLKIFYSSHILPHISFSSTVWDACGETHLNKLNSLHRRAAKLLLPDKNSSTDEKNESP